MSGFGETVIFTCCTSVLCVNNLRVFFSGSLAIVGVCKLLNVWFSLLNVNRAFCAYHFCLFSEASKDKKANSRKPTFLRD